MPVTYIYKLPLFHAYEYSLVRSGAPRPDDLDEEGVLHQILTYDDERRLVKVESCVNGAIAVEKNIFFTAGRLSRETESFIESGGTNELVYRYRADGWSRECFIEKASDWREEYTQQSGGPVTAFRKYDASDELIESWEANERGDIVRTRIGDREIRFDYTYDADGRVTRKRTRSGEDESSEEFRYDPEGRLVEAIGRGNGAETHAHYRYEHGKLVKEERIENDLVVGQVLYREETDGAIRHREETGKDDFRRETIEETDPRGRYKVLLERGKEPIYDGRGQFHRHVVRASVSEIKYDADGRITDILVSDTKFADAALGIECDANAYYFLEYENA